MKNCPVKLTTHCYLIWSGVLCLLCLRLLVGCASTPRTPGEVQRDAADTIFAGMMNEPSCRPWLITAATVLCNAANANASRETLEANLAALPNRHAYGAMVIERILSVLWQPDRPDAPARLRAICVGVDGALLK